ncbi:MAG TPA: hypothetical protein VL003_08325, partial [Pusillimonas sp.]|uniref:hypothetical protein n=1 Tax=Pusillimonas sp. TaxID=3040095 RepID=UPI002C7F4B38
ALLVLETFLPHITGTAVGMRANSSCEGRSSLASIGAVGHFGGVTGVGDTSHMSHMSHMSGITANSTGGPMREVLLAPQRS